MSNNNNNPSLVDAIIPLAFLVVSLSSSVYVFGDSSSSGPNQIALLLAMGVASIIGIKNGFSWKQIEEGIVHGISLSLGAILILLSVGALIGTWLLAGTVPSLIYYGLELIDPSVFYFVCCIVCSIVAMSIGSSWTTAATVGVALMGVSHGMGLSPAITAGAIISGAYFGDKVSPLSETTNLAPAVAGTQLFEHIRYMLITTVPSYILALVMFLVVGLNIDDSGSNAQILAMQSSLAEEFNISVLMLVPLAVLLTMAIKKVPAFPAVSIGAIIGGFWAVIFQPEVIQQMYTGELSGVWIPLTVVWTAMFDGVVFSTANENLNDLLSGGGMSGMLGTIWLIMCALTFGAVLEKVGLLKRIVSMLLSGAKSAGDMVSRTVVTCFGTNLITADQYMSIVMPGRMYKDEFEKRGLNQLNLSRSLEDGGTLTSPLIPWNTCGAYMHGVLKVDPLSYAMYCFFNLINPIVSITFAYMGIKILRTVKGK